MKCGSQLKFDGTAAISPAAWSTIDMEFMNVNQPAQRGCEFGFRLRPLNIVHRLYIPMNVPIVCQYRHCFSYACAEPNSFFRMTAVVLKKAKRDSPLAAPKTRLHRHNLELDAITLKSSCRDTGIATFDWVLPVHQTQ